MASALFLQLSENDIDLFEYLEINTRSIKSIVSLEARIDELLECWAITERPEWLVSLLSDPKFQSLKFDGFSLESFFSHALHAFTGLAIIDSSRKMPMAEGVERKGFNPDLEHMRWVQALSDKIDALSSIYPEQTKAELVNYVVYAERFDISFERFLEMQAFRINTVWIRHDAGHFFSWYAETLKQLDESTSQFKQFMIDAQRNHDREPLTEENLPETYPFRDMHPMLLTSAYDKFMSQINQPTA